MSSDHHSELPFKLAIPDQKLAYLRAKLELTTFPDELDEAGWSYGAPLTDIRRLVTRWKDGYDWRKYEAEINEELPQYTSDIEVESFGVLNIHFVHCKSEVADAVPLLFVHGWPGSFLEVRKILPLLTADSPEHPSFHVVALSLPGFGFSTAPTKKGFGIAQYAEIGNKLMLSLGYNEYVTQGGDWGFMITQKMAHLYGGTHIKAWHTNSPLASPPHPIHRPFLFLSHLLIPYTPQEKVNLERAVETRKTGFGFYAQQSTKPQTLGYALADSPVGLLAWVYEKLAGWTDEYVWDDDEVLTWISIYWFSRAGPAASLRIYYESTQEEGGSLSTSSIPLGFSYFAKEVIRLPKRWTRIVGNLVFEADHERGGHFPSHEKPEELVGDLRKMFGVDEPCFGVVPGKSGYAVSR